MSFMETTNDRTYLVQTIGLDQTLLRASTALIHYKSSKPLGYSNIGINFSEGFIGKYYDDQNLSEEYMAHCDTLLRDKVMSRPDFISWK